MVWTRTVRIQPKHPRLFTQRPTRYHQTCSRKGSDLPSLLLASASEIRGQLLRQAGVSLEQVAARIDEDAIKLSLVQEGATPRDIADALAEYKARKIAEKMPGRVVLGCDQVLQHGKTCLSKPEDRETARQQLLALRGSQHQQLSAAVLYEDGEPVWRMVGIARLTMHALSEDEVDRYLDLAWPDVSNSVGAYHLEAEGVRLFSRIDGDWFSALGMPLLDIVSYLRSRGWQD